MMKRNYHLREIIFLMLCIVCKTSIAQKQGQEKIDSVLSVLKKEKDDTSKVNTLNVLSFAFKLSKPDTSVYYAEKALKLATSLNYKMGIAESYLRIGDAQKNVNKYVESLKNSSTALNLYDSLLSHLSEKELAENKSLILQQKANVFNSIGFNYYYQGNYPQALKYFFAFLKTSREGGYKKGIADSYNNIGSIYNEQGEYNEALKYYFSGLKSSKEIGDKKSIANSYQNIGIIYYFQGNYVESLINQSEGLKIREEIGDKKGISNSYIGIGNIYNVQGNYSEALKYQISALKINEETGNKKGTSDSYNNIGIIYYMLHNYSEALNNQLISLKISEEINNKKGVSGSYYSIGNIYDIQDKNFEALSNYFKSLKISEEIGDKVTIMASSISIGNIFTRQKKYKEAFTYLNKGLLISKENGSLEFIRDSYIGLADLDSSQNKFKESMENYKMYIIYRDSLFNEEKTKKLVQSQMQFEFDKKEAITKAEQEKKNAIAKGELEKQKLLRNSIAGGAGIITLSALLSFVFYKRKRDTEQLQKETALSLQISETEMKALRSQMNPHFIFNALQSIQTFLMNHKSEEANIYLLKFSKLMRAVLENSQHREISLKKDMQALELYMQLESIRLLHPFTYQFHIDDSFDIEETTIPPLILQPFVENAIWHGLQYKTEPGHINIYLSKIDNALHAVVEDNGIGRDMHKQVNQPMLLKKESLGMKLTEERLKVLNELKKIRAQFKITDLFTKENRPAGTRVELTLP